MIVVQDIFGALILAIWLGYFGGVNSRMIYESYEREPWPARLWRNLAWGLLSVVYGCFGPVGTLMLWAMERDSPVPWKFWARIR